MFCSSNCIINRSSMKVSLLIVWKWHAVRGVACHLFIWRSEASTIHHNTPNQYEAWKRFCLACVTKHDFNISSNLPVNYSSSSWFAWTMAIRIQNESYQLQNNTLNYRCSGSSVTTCFFLTFRVSSDTNSESKERCIQGGSGLHKCYIYRNNERNAYILIY